MLVGVGIYVVLVYLCMHEVSGTLIDWLLLCGSGRLEALLLFCDLLLMLFVCLFVCLLAVLVSCTNERDDAM